MQYLDTPWALLHTSQPAASGHPVLAVADGSSPLLRDGKVRLPVHTPQVSGQPAIFDLPYAVRSDTVSSLVESGDATLSFLLSGQIPFPDQRLLRQFDHHQSLDALRPTQQRQLVLYNFIDAMVGIMEELRWEAELDAQDADDWFTTPRPTLAPIPWPQLAKVLEEPVHELRMDLICKIASQFDTVLFKLAANPHKILHRHRTRQHLSKVQQLDSACLAWLTRQPGLSPIEKAGARQQIMAVARTEGYDTLENRVLKDVLSRCQRSARLYLHQNQAYADKSRYRMVQQFDRRCRKALRSSVFKSIHALTTVPQPNYVLQHDKAYHELWHWYLRLVKRETATLEAWRWQHRLWADMVRLIACSCIYGDGDWSSPLEQFVWLREGPESGNWIAGLESPGPVIRGARVIETFYPAIMEPAPWFGLPLATWAAAAGCDLVILESKLNGGPDRVTFVWAIHDAHSKIDRAALQVLADDADAALDRLGSDIVATEGFIVVNDCHSEVSGVSDIRSRSGRTRAVQVAGHPGQWLRDLAALTREQLIS